MTSSILPIIAHARAGALDHALRMFHAAGFEEVSDDPSVLALKGRLLKDQARRADGEARRALYERSSEAYGRAAELDETTYPLINAASLSLLSGAPARARELAGKVLQRLESGSEEADTPYWRAATRAEAELLLGRTSDAGASLRDAIAVAPMAWEDHAATLRQFGLILATRGEDAAWLEPLRPPRALHFAGQLGADPADASLAEQVAAVLRAERVGFGYGALAAGADIVIAEALLTEGAELHLVLPSPSEAFRLASVTPLGKDWLPRYDTVLSKATTVTCVAETVDRQSVKLAAQAAMGRAVMQARLLASEAVQLVAPAAGAPQADGWAAAVWSGAGRRTISLPARRARSAPGGGLAEGAGQILAILAIGGPPTDVVGWLGALNAAWDSAGVRPASGALWTGSALLASFADPLAAARAARALRPILPDVRISGDLGSVDALSGPGGASLLVGTPVTNAGRLLDSVPPGAALVTELFATTLCSVTDESLCPCEPVGELPARAGDGGPDLPVFSLDLA